MNSEFLDSVAAFEINGRQIKNAARVAHALAAKHKRPLEPEDVLSTLEALRSFDKDFTEHSVKRTDSTANGNTASHMVMHEKSEVVNVAPST